MNDTYQFRYTENAEIQVASLQYIVDQTIKHKSQWVSKG